MLSGFLLTAFAPQDSNQSVRWAHREEEGHEASGFDAKGGKEQCEGQINGLGQLSKPK